MGNAGGRGGTGWRGIRGREKNGTTVITKSIKYIKKYIPGQLCKMKCKEQPETNVLLTEGGWKERGKNGQMGMRQKTGGVSGAFLNILFYRKIVLML